MQMFCVLHDKSQILYTQLWLITCYVVTYLHRFRTRSSRNINSLHVYILLLSVFTSKIWVGLENIHNKFDIEWNKKTHNGIFISGMYQSQICKKNEHVLATFNVHFPSIGHANYIYTPSAI